MNTRNSGPKYILFDFDGVIADSLDVGLTLNKEVCATITKERWLDAFEGNVRDWDRNTASWHSPDCKHTIIDWFAAYIPLMRRHVEIFPGIGAVLKELSEKYTFIIISSCPTEPIKEFLQKNNIDQYFVEVLGSDIHKSKVEKIKMVFSKHKAEARDCIFVTDTLGDMREAREMNVDCIGTSWGYHEPERLLKGNPFRIVDSPNDLIEAVSDYFKQRNQQAI